MGYKVAVVVVGEEIQGSVAHLVRQILSCSPQYSIARSGSLGLSSGDLL